MVEAFKGRIHTINYGSISAGPLDRTEVFFQGCRRNCSGCFSPETHDYEGGLEVTAEDLVTATYPKDYVDGFPPRITICGGEPFDQPTFLFDYVYRLRAILALNGDEQPTILAYTGYDYGSLAGDPDRRAILELIDMLVTESYDETQKVMARPTDFIGSANQWFIMLNKADVAFSLDAVNTNELVANRRTAEMLDATAATIRSLTRF